MEFYVFDLDFNFLGIVDNYKEVKIQNNYTKKSIMNMKLFPTIQNIDLLKEERIITRSNDIAHGFIIETIEYADGNKEELSITAFSLNHVLGRRIVLGQQELTGNVEDVMKGFVNLNAISTVLANRSIPNLILSTNKGIGPATKEGCSDKQLDDYLFEIANKYEVSYDVLFDYNNKKLVFDVWKGINRSTEQLINPQVIFSKEFENVINQNYFESNSELKTTGIVAGEGEGSGRIKLTINDNYSGLNRRELFIDARDLQKSYKRADGTEVVLSDENYNTLLINRGLSKLKDNESIKTFESEIDTNSTFKFGIDYYLGDIVSVRNTKFNLILHTRIISVEETYNGGMTLIKLNFGSNIPTLLDKIKKKLR